MFRSRIRQIRADAGNAVEPSACRHEAGPRGIPRCGVEGSAALREEDAAELPSTNDLIDDASMIQQSLSFSEGERVKHGCHEAMRNVKGRRPFVAGAAAHILGSELISLATNGAGIIE